MIRYLDSSALVKPFLAEAHSVRVRQAISRARLIVTHVIAYVEACATFARVAHARGGGALFPALRPNSPRDRQDGQLPGFRHHR